jgi:hypothetical protein
MLPLEMTKVLEENAGKESSRQFSNCCELITTRPFASHLLLFLAEEIFL